jgi:archaellum biogenesis ATPase FlaH
VSNERTIIAACIKDRGCYDAIHGDVKADDLTAQARIIYQSVEEYYALDGDAKCVDADILLRAVERKVSNPKHRAAFGTMVGQLVDLEVSTPNVVADLLKMKQDTLSNTLGAALCGSDDALIKKLMEEYMCVSTRAVLEGEDDAGVTGEELLTMAESAGALEDLIKLLPRVLNDALGGGVLRGHHVILFARPEMGKTMFLVNAIAGFLRQSLKVKYCGNEDPLRDIASRVVGRLSDMTEEERGKDPELTRLRAIQHGIENLTCHHMEPGTAAQLDRLCAIDPPDVLIVDQLRNLHSKEDGFTQQLEHIARDVRTVGQKHQCLVVSVTQAGGSAEGQAILDMNDVDSSKTGIPAQADVMIGMGGTEQDVAMNRRVLSLCKNKRNGNHAVLPIVVQPQLSKLSG